MKKKNRVLAMVLCFLTGPVGGHFIYLEDYHRAKKRFLWFFFCNPVAFYNTLLDLGKIGLRNDYYFRANYCNNKIRGTETDRSLQKYVTTKIKSNP